MQPLKDAVIESTASICCISDGSCKYQKGPAKCIAPPEAIIFLLNHCIGPNLDKLQIFNDYKQHHKQ